MPVDPTLQVMLAGSRRGTRMNLAAARNRREKAWLRSVAGGFVVMRPLFMATMGAELASYRRRQDRRVYEDADSVVLVSAIGTPCWHASSWITREPGAGKGRAVFQRMLSDADAAGVDVELQASNHELARKIYVPAGFDYASDAERTRRRPRLRRASRGGTP